MINRSLKISLLTLALSFSFINTSNADGHKLNLAWEVAGLANPESVVYDPRLNLLYVSNVNGGPMTKTVMDISP